MEAEGIILAIKQGDVLVCEGKLRRVFFEPLSTTGAFVYAKQMINSISLENGRFTEFSANVASCRKASPKETKRFIALKQRSKYLK